MLTFIFTRQAEKEFLKLDKNIANTLIEKLKELKDESLFESHTKPIQNLLPATHRIRIGNYRLLIEKNEGEIVILALGHRREIYK